MICIRCYQVSTAHHAAQVDQQKESGRKATRKLRDASEEVAEDADAEKTIEILLLTSFCTYFERSQKSGFVKGRFWRMCPRSGCWGPGRSKIIAFFCQCSAAVQGKTF